MTIALLVLVGLGIGVISGLFGIGGGILLVPILVWFFDKDQKQAQGLSLAVLSVPIMIPTVWQYYVNGFIRGNDLITAGWLALGFVAGGLLGVYLLGYVSGPTVRLVFALLLIYVGTRFLMATDNDFAAALVGLGTVLISWIAFLSLRALGRAYRPPPRLTEAIRVAADTPWEGDYYI
jgi:uncharacterized protein